MNQPVIIGFSNPKDSSLRTALELMSAEGLITASNSKKYLILPGLCDVHVHFREPGFSYKETIATGSRSAAAGGFTDVMTMPNLNPVPDCKENLDIQLELIKRDAVIGVHPYASITEGERGARLSRMEELSPYVRAFSDDGRGVQDGELMLEAMKRVKELDRVLAAHCEQLSLLCGGYIHDGEYAKRHSHLGISSESEYAQIARDLELAAKTEVKYHVCHISAAKSVELIRQAKRSGVDVSCETAPHYLFFCEDELREDGSFKMNPPLRSASDREALLEGAADGTIDMIATDHAPHSSEEKSRGLRDSLMGVVGLETAFAASYSMLVENGIVSLERLYELLCKNPRERFGIEPCGAAVFELEVPYTVVPERFVTKGRATPFDGATLGARCIMTVIDDKAVYKAPGLSGCEDNNDFWRI